MPADSLYALGGQLILNGGVNWASDVIMCVPVNVLYTPDLVNHQFYSDIQLYISCPPRQLVTASFAGTAFADEVVFGVIPGGPQIAALVCFENAGQPNISPLMANFSNSAFLDFIENDLVVRALVVRGLSLGRPSPGLFESATSIQGFVLTYFRPVGKCCIGRAFRGFKS